MNIEEQALKPTNDYVFKRIFGKVGNEFITSSFIKAVTGVEYKNIVLNESTVLERDYPNEKEGVLDVKVITENNENIDIEMQVAKNEYIVERILWYWAKMYASTIEKGERYERSKKCIIIFIADFNLSLLKDVQKFHTSYHITEDEIKSLLLTDKLEINIIELSKLDKMADEKNTELLNWCRFIKSPETLEDTIMNNNEAIKKAQEELEKLRANKEERENALSRENYLIEKIGELETAYEDGIEKGIDKTKIEIARKMLEKNIKISEISELTGLSEEEINKLK